MKRQRSSVDKGCYTCERRRIKCDRGSPSCLKCSRKGLICPGYGQRIRWAGGAAVRGRLAQSRDTRPLSPGLPVSTDWASQHSLTNKTLQRLVEYWDKQVAPLMVWVDSDSNPYRIYITPLAYGNSVIGLAMAAVSSQHSGSEGDAAFSEKARNEAVGMISAYVKDMTDHVMSGHELSNKLDDKSVECVLAAMLLLSCYEMANSGGAAADFHRRAARSLVNTFQTTGRGGSLLFNFLRNQLCVHDVLACTTSFDLSTMQDVILPDTKDDSVLFSSYLSYLHDVTLLSRQLSPSLGGCARMGLTLSHIRAQFEVARGETLMTAGRLALQPENRRRDFISVVNIHHYAALLYAIRVLDLGIQAQTREDLVDALFDQIAIMTAVDEWLHTLAWCFFIAGVETHGDKSRQAIISKLYGRICDKMRFHNFREALHFLEMFWAGTERDWQVLARSWEVAGHPVLLP
ncbi:hypothetical protein NM208_g8605 [Fusarium decemcellulare]|uniref:Uncharacterized protein n=1 Tax=Fusarium decemcellulare TaxID=57161 RepID=A0ACC1S4P9_9HYPO|nr:hypothetical protein NM208_g8605 [Fusarium decemcellulare]